MIPDDAPTRKMGPGAQPGLKIGGCLLESQLGRGGMGSVWLARQLSLDRAVAVKILSPALSADDLFIERFQREARLAGRLNSPNIVQIHDAGMDSGIGFIVMERLEGQTLQDRLDRKGPLDEATVLAMLFQLAGGLAVAHSANLIHRDIKPGNVFLCQDGTVKLLDFGLVRERSSALTQPGEVLGTPHYMSPEQCDGKAADEQSDLYSLGATAYAALAGAPPFQADTPVALLRKHLDEEPRPLRNVRQEVNGLILSLMAKDPRQRPLKAQDIARSVQAVLQGGPPPRRPLNLRPLAIPAVILTGLAGIVAIVLLLSSKGDLSVLPTEREKNRRFAVFKVRVLAKGAARGELEIHLAPKPGVALCGSHGETHGHKHAHAEFGIDLSAPPEIQLDRREVLYPELRSPETFRVPFHAAGEGTHTVSVSIKYQAVLEGSEALDSFDDETVDLEVPVVVN